MGDAAGWEVGAKDVERAALAGAGFDMDVVKERFVMSGRVSSKMRVQVLQTRVLIG